MKKQMYAVSVDGVGIVEGTLAYSRQGAIRCWQGKGALDEIDATRWERHKSQGYRTVKALVEIVARFGTYRR